MNQSLQYPGVSQQSSFTIRLSADYFAKGDKFTLYNNSTFVVRSTPKKKWYHLLFQYITFGLYRAKWSYKIKLVD